MPNDDAKKGWRNFVLIWLGQLVSLTGSGLTTFGLGVWVFQRTGSAAAFTLIYVCATAPALLMAPIAGVLVDRWDRRRMLIISNLGAAIGPAIFVLLLLTHRLALWHVYVVVAIATVFLSCQFPAFGAAITMLVPKAQLGRASGMMQMGQSSARIVAPLLAGALLPVIHLQGLLLIDFFTFLFGMVTLLFATIPRPAASAVGSAARGSLFREAAFGWAYLRERPGLLSLLGFFSIMNLFFAMSLVLITPLVLSLTSPRQLGLVLAVGSAGLLAGGILMSIWGGPARRMYGILGFSPLLGLSLLLVGSATWVPAIMVGAFAMYFLVPIINGSDQALWQSKVEPDVQGRVFAMRQLLSQFTAPLAYLAAGPLADRVFNPLLRPGGALAGSVGRWLGVGQGRGIGLQFVVMGCLLTLAALTGLAYPHLRGLDEEIPDAIPDPAAAGG
ncbi:MAG TPA: MFS transporter [Thermoanaerobaculia bacterium]|jgi:MFS family permease|nr:MFS transporter [Thermoanaerobaculia bacterium]